MATLARDESPAAVSTKKRKLEDDITLELPASKKNVAPLSPPDAAESDCSCLPPPLREPVVVRRYCLIFAEHVPDTFFDGDTESEACKRVEAVVAAANADAKTSGCDLVLHKYTEGCAPYHLNADDGELWCNLPETALEPLMQDLGDYIEAIVEEISY